MSASRVSPLFVLLLLLVGACVSAPVQEMSNARQAIAAAEEAGANEHAPGDLAAAQRLLDTAQTRLADKRFREARRAAVAAKTRAIAALKATGDPQQ
ncbi:MAG: DUF4398 domain-containing protein [Gammaproteobacteria bacterium]|nr:DUF4398 domain-containing protein [Gammaproteobacteria bacterium]